MTPKPNRGRVGRGSSRPLRTQGRRRRASRGNLQRRALDRAGGRREGLSFVLAGVRVEDIELEAEGHENFPKEDEVGKEPPELELVVDEAPIKESCMGLGDQRAASRCEKARACMPV